MTTINEKMNYVPVVEYHCESCGRVLGRDEVREGLNPSKGKLYLYRWYRGYCPGCGAKLKRPELDDCTVADMTASLCGTREVTSLATRESAPTRVRVDVIRGHIYLIRCPWCPNVLGSRSARRFYGVVKAVHDVLSGYHRGQCPACGGTLTGFDKE